MSDFLVSLPAWWEVIRFPLGAALCLAGGLLCLIGTVGVLRAALQVASSDEGSARILTEQLAISAAAAELRRQGAGQIADAFVESRLAGQWRTTYGMLDARHDARVIVDTLYPELS